MKKIAINGLGRVGRLILRRYIEGSYRNFSIVALNDPMPLDNIHYLLKYDSVHGPLQREVTITDHTLCVDDQSFALYNRRDAESLPWDEPKIDFVLECSGQYRHHNRVMQHIKAGADRVVITAPSGDADITLVMGVNEDNFDPEQHIIISNASCTTNCLAPVLKILMDDFGVERALVTTVHAYTASQSMVDVAAGKPHRGRAGALNIIPTTTGADACTMLVLPELRDRVIALALRVPVANVALIDISAVLTCDVKKEEINNAFRQAARGTMRDIVQYSDEQLVSSDIIGNRYSAVIHGLATRVLQRNMVNIFAWYDNEYAYACRCLDLLEKLCHQPLKVEPIIF